MTTHAEYLHLCEEVWRYNRLYYVEHKSEISDQQFDQLLQRLQEIEEQHPAWITPASPTQRVGETPSEGFVTVKHRIPMLSLANTYSVEEVADFVKRVQKLAERSDIPFAAELKMDGVAVTAVYEKGVFTRGVTRGDGKAGDEITANMRTIKALPLQLYGSVPDHLEVRGEVFIPHDAFEAMNAEAEAASEEPWANPRNAASGSLKLLDPKEVAKRPLAIAFYTIAEESSGLVTSQYGGHQFIKALGLPGIAMTAYCTSLEQVMEFANQVHAKRSSLPFDIDGIVVKVDDLTLQKRLGATGKTPRWAVAYKFAPEQAITRITEITVQVGRTGTLTPVAELEPVFLAGSTISRATLHNAEEVQRKDIRIGDAVWIEKGGDVIPKVVSVDVSKRLTESEPWQMPSHCPCCGTAVARIDGEVAVRCPNPECPEQLWRRLAYFAGKGGMDIEHMGIKVVEQLINSGFVKRRSDIYALTAEQLAQLPNFKEKSVQNLLASIDKSRHVSLARFLMALGIKHVGTGTAEDLAAKAGSIENLSQMTKDELLAIDGIGEKVADSICAYFADPESCAEIERLRQLGVNPQTVEVISQEGHPFFGKTFVLTGTMQRYTRTEATSLIKARGGKVAATVTKNTDYLVCGDDAGSKLEKASKLGVAILFEDQFSSLI